MRCKENCKDYYPIEFDTLPESSTNSEIGSYHWFHTLVARHKHIGEFLKKKTPDEEILRTWGKFLYDDMEELINGYKFINRKE